MIELKKVKFQDLDILKVLYPIDLKNIELEDNKNKIILHHPGNRAKYSMDLIK